MFVPKQGANSAHKSGTTPGQVTVSAGRLLMQLQSNGDAACARPVNETMPIAIETNLVAIRILMGSMCYATPVTASVCRVMRCPK